MCLIAPPEKRGSVCTRNFIPHRVHEAIGVLGAVSVATACLIPGTVAQGIANVSQTGMSKNLPGNADNVSNTGNAGNDHVSDTPDNTAVDITGRDQTARIEVEHPTGSFTVSMGLAYSNDQVTVTRSALLRTARKLFKGEVYIPHSIWAGHS